MNELKPCPCCGSTARPVGSRSGINPHWKLCRVICDRCGLTTANHSTPEEAAAAWNTRATPPRAEVDVLREKAKLADEYAACMKELRDEDGDIYGWDDTHSGNTIVGMDIGDVKDWLARYEALSPAATPPRAEVDVALVREYLEARDAFQATDAGYEEEATPKEWIDASNRLVRADEALRRALSRATGGNDAT